ncbi:MAG: NTP transferase domain-containing protein [Candidatus Hydrogenedentes bacterium]|nr:NTP transferase domain-containing protein [Candidatus Hydrogenedentota bacterium]
MPTGTYQGVILAAGQGSRMGPLTDHYPKALLPVTNVPLIVRHLETLRSLGIQEAFVVVGHLGQQIRDALGDGTAFGMALHYVEQERREGLAQAVGMLEAHISKPFVLLLGDIYFAFKDLVPLIEHFEFHRASAAIAVKDESDPALVRRNFSVEMNDTGQIRRVVEKPTEVASLWKGCGLYLFGPTIFDAIRRTPRSSLRNEYELTDAIQTLIDDGRPVYGTPVVDKDVNVTTPDDLIACNRHALRAMGKPHLVGENCQVAQGTTLHETVLGDGVCIVQPCRLEGCVVLPGTVIDSAMAQRDRVLYPASAPE